jgi:cytochrome c biogenesis factor
VVNDLYSSVIGLQQNGKSATFRFFLNPGVTWLWVGGALMVLAGIAAALPSWRRRRRKPEPRGGSNPTENRELVETGAN